jgi:hypothetical protein
MPFLNEDDLRTALFNLQYLIAHCTAPDKLTGYYEMKAECNQRLLVMLNPETAKRLRRAEALLASSQQNIAATRELLCQYWSHRKTNEVDAWREVPVPQGCWDHQSGARQVWRNSADDAGGVIASNREL